MRENVHIKDKATTKKQYTVLLGLIVLISFMRVLFLSLIFVMLVKSTISS